MSQQSITEKLYLKEEKSLLIQGLPSSIEKQFAKLSFAKNVTPLLRTRKIEWALVFAVNENQLNGILKEVLPALHPEGKLWVSYPKTASKISSDLNRDCSWNGLTTTGYESIAEVALDHVWSALLFQRKTEGDMVATPNGQLELQDSVDKPEAEANHKQVVAPSEMVKLFGDNPEAKVFFETLSLNHQKEYVTWISGARKEETKTKRLEATMQMLNAGKLTPVEK